MHGRSTWSILWNNYFVSKKIEITVFVLEMLMCNELPEGYADGEFLFILADSSLLMRFAFFALSSRKLPMLSDIAAWCSQAKQELVILADNTYYRLAHRL